MKLKYRFLKIFLLTILLGFLMNFAIRRHNNKDIDKIRIHIENSDRIHFITNNMVEDIINRSSKNGNKANKIKDIDIIKTEKNLDSNPFVSQSNVYIGLDGVVNIVISQKTPIVRIKTPQKEFYLDKDGTPFPLSPNFSLPCMMVSGNIRPDEYPKLAKLCHLISVDNLFKNHIVAIDKDKRNSYNLLLNINGVYIEYGELENNRQKLINLKEFYNQYLDYVGFDAYKKISLKYDNQIVATKR
ncbi:MAG: cell division protein FtsQ/DivIB [Flavobacteriaceae bacterium]|jgi:cell division protein FtsQ|nr:cell division protein FtsQ/DivIB [Flavobacteriaceae bacterium]